jgi:hypothetical protein
MPFFGVGGDRFRSNKEFTPGPGDYDPAKARGFKADPKSGFLTGDRFHELEREGNNVPSQGVLEILCLATHCRAVHRHIGRHLALLKGLHLRSLHQGKGERHR